MTKSTLMKTLRKVAEHKQFAGFSEWGADSTFYSTNAVFSNGSIVRLTGVAQGTQSDDRIGDKITGTSCHVKLFCNPDTYFTGERAHEWIMRCIIFIYKDDDIPNQDDLLKQYPSAPAYQLPLEPYDVTKKVKSKILYDGIMSGWVSQSPGSSTTVYHTTSPMPIIRDIRINLTKLKRGLNVVNFQGTPLTGVNHIYLLLKSNIPSGSQTSTWDVFQTTDYRFIDM